MANLILVGDDGLQHIQSKTGDVVTLPVGTTMSGPAGSIPASMINGGVGPSGAAGGDLGGTYPNPTVEKSESQVLVTPEINGAVVLNPDAITSLSSQLGSGIKTTTLLAKGFVPTNGIPKNFYGKLDNVKRLGEPIEWGVIKVNGIDRLIPLFEKE